MAVQDFAIELIEELLNDKELALTEENIRFYDKGTTAETDESLDDHIRWRNARYYNADSNVIRSSLLIVQLPVGSSAEYINFHMGELCRMYRKDGMSKVLPIVKRDIRAIKASAAKNLALLNQFGDYEAIKDQLIIRPLNYDDNDKALVKAIYRKVGDMALVLYISLGNMDQGNVNNIISAMVPRDTFQAWELDEKEVFDQALENTMRLQPPVFLDISSSFRPSLKIKHILFMDDDTVKTDFDSRMALALSTAQEINGAIAVFYPGVQERLYQMVGGDFYLVFTSISEVHIYPVNGWFKVSTMRSVLADTNRDMNKKGELLTRRIYRYSGEKKEISGV